MNVLKLVKIGLLSTALLISTLCRGDMPMAMSAGLIVAGEGGVLHSSSYSEPFKEWRIAIVDAFGRNLYEISGNDSVPPAEVMWDGRADDGRYLAHESRWRVSSTFVKVDGNSSYGFGYVRMQRPEEGGQAWENAFGSRIITETLPSGSGGSIEVSTPHTYSMSIGWRMIVRSLDGGYEYSRQWADFDEQVITDEIFKVDWDGRTNEGLVFPDGEYEIVFESTFYDTIYAPYTREDKRLIRIGSLEPDEEPKSSDEVDDVHEQPVLPAYCSDRNPVLLIHGLNSYPTMWSEVDRDYVSLLMRQGYSREFIGLYNYSGQGAGRDGYNNQGGVVEVSRGMRQAVDELSQKSMSCGGEGEVDIVAHSMGGLIARQYLADYQTDHMIDKVITVATPYRGSWLLEWRNKPFISGPVDYASKISDYVLQGSSYSYLDTSSKAYFDLTPGSKLLERLFNHNGGADQDSLLLYGSIKSFYAVSLFNVELSSQVYDLGDLIVSSESASKASLLGKGRTQSFQSSIIKLELSLDYPHLPLPAYKVKHIDMDSLKYSHVSILAQPDVRDKIIQTLIE